MIVDTYEVSVGTKGMLDELCTNFQFCAFEKKLVDARDLPSFLDASCGELL